jgi:hypothetical protein
MSAGASGWCWKNSPFEGGMLLVHLALADVANDVYENELWMTHATVAAKAKVSRSTVDRTLRALIELGMLELVAGSKGPGQPSRYRMLFPKACHGDTPLTLEGMSPENERHVTSAPPSTTNLSTNSTGSQKRARDVIFEAICAVCNIDLEQLTDDERGRVNKAAKQLRALGVVAPDIVSAAIVYGKIYPNAALTPQGLTGNWSRLRPQMSVVREVRPEWAVEEEPSQEVRDAARRNIEALAQRFKGGVEDGEAVR